MSPFTRIVPTIVAMACIAGVGSRADSTQTAQPSQPPASDAEITRGAAALVDRYRELGWFNGAVLVARGDTVLYRGAAGFATLDHPTRLTEDSPLRIVGLSQLFTVALTLKMVEDGRVVLDDPIGKTMTGWPDAYKPITIRQLLLGTSGVRDVTQIPEFVRTIAVPRSLYELTQIILKETPVGPPGTFGRAQNSDYHLLAAVLETAGGAPFDTLLERHILAPLQLTHTRYDDPTAVIIGRAVGMVRRQGALSHASLFHMSNAVGMAHLVSTVDDVHQFIRAFLTGRIVRQSLVDLALEGHVSQLPPGVTLPQGVQVRGIPFRGFGWSVADGQLSNISSINGATASLQLTPASGIVIIALSNVASGEANAVASAIQSLVLGNPQPLPERRTPVALTESDRARMAGTWEIANSATMAGSSSPVTVVVRNTGGRMFVRFGAGVESEWFSDGAGRLFDPHADRQFQLGVDGTTASFKNQGRTMPLVRAK